MEIVFKDDLTETKQTSSNEAISASSQPEFLYGTKQNPHKTAMIIWHGR